MGRLDHGVRYPSIYTKALRPHTRMFTDGDKVIELVKMAWKSPENPDGVDESFFEFTDIDLRNIDQRVTNIKNGVIEFEDCGEVKVPVDYNTIISELNNLKFVKDSDLVDACDNLTNVLADNPLWGINAKATIDFNFVKLLVQGIVATLLGQYWKILPHYPHLQHLLLHWLLLRQC